MRRFAATTPGLLIALAVVTVTLCLLAGITGADQLGAKVSRHERVLAHTEPVAFAAQRLYVALSAADAAAAEAFLSGGIESPQVRARYQQALADAAAALADATVGASDERTGQIVARIAADLPAYTGLVETARANNRQGFPVGSAYLREASALMRDSLLKNAEALSGDRFAAVRADQRDIAAVPGTTVALLALALLACALGSWLLVRRTNRWANPGLLVAAGAALAALLWILASGAIAAAALDNDDSGPSRRFETLARARILAQQARTDETLQLIVRGDIAQGEQSYAEHVGDLRAMLDTGSPAAAELGMWVEGHRTQVAAYRAADYNAALRQAIGTDATSSATRFVAVDTAIGADLTAVRADLRERVDDAGDALSWSPMVTLLLMSVAAVAVVVGLWPRLKEFL
ncbi:hypothetical protein IT779_29515 [Nocardia sp. NEAU-351]|uniref:Chemotaxis methyl-accepting receptor HlyB-like 4HB MCP domain-containing protein n=1 Tax=Nocardia bovistercoris TaxID=2785916 RepID=A0A931IH08_9NOCA|nr:hypothetical protein [Nocardia bovistercoris]MBH0780418.1 hypothetical protein [Nocardia bovistercoris]